MAEDNAAPHWSREWAAASAVADALVLVDRFTLAGMAARVQVREISDDEGKQLVRTVRRGSGSVVTWRRAQMVLWPAQHISVPQIAKLAFTSEDRVRDVLHNFNADGLASLYPRYCGGRPPVFTLAQGREVKKAAKSKPADHGLPFSRWSLAKLADFLVAISHEELRALLRVEGLLSGRRPEAVQESARVGGVRGKRRIGSAGAAHRVCKRRRRRTTRRC